MVSIYKNCLNCGAALGGDATWRKKFCNDACRVNYHRKSSPNALYADAIKPIRALGKFKAARDRKDAIESLKDLKVLIDQALTALGDQDTLDRNDMRAGIKPAKVRCNECGQARFSMPAPGEKCSFCGKNDWSVQS